jgi:Transmembrane amino acid transporter protein
VSSLIGSDAWAVGMNAGILLHCIIAYVVNVNVCCSTLLHLVSPAHMAELHAGRTAARARWLLATAAVVAAAACIAYALPFFSLVMAVISSLGDVMSMAGLPCIFALQLLKLSRTEAAVCRVLSVIAVGLSAVGMVCSLQQLVAAAAGGGGGR